jgi:hypothetical protein
MSLLLPQTAGVLYESRGSYACILALSCLKMTHPLGFYAAVANVSATVVYGRSASRSNRCADTIDESLL